VRRFFVIQENLERARWRRRCIKECATGVAQVTGALFNATRLRTALGGAQVPPTKLFRRLTALVDKTIVGLQPRVAAALKPF